MKKQKWSFKSLLRLDIICSVVFICIFFYFVWKAEKKEYPFFEDDSDMPKLSDMYTTQEDSRPRSVKAARPQKREQGQTSRPEIYAKKVLQQLFPGKHFTKIRPNWLKNPVTGKNLEIDIFCADISTPLGKGLCVEVDGIQHSMYNPFFHKTKDHFTYQYKKDAFKDKMCKQYGYAMLRIPYFITEYNMEDYIVKELKKMKVL